MKSTLNSATILQYLNDRIKARGWMLKGYCSVENGDGLQAPGVTKLWVVDPAKPAHRQNIVYGFFNAQDKGFHHGHYDISEKTAKELIA